MPYRSGHVQRRPPGRILPVDLGTGGVHLHEAHGEDWKVDLIDTGPDTFTGGRVKMVEAESRVSRKFDSPNRLGKLTWTHHYVVAGLELERPKAKARELEGTNQYTEPSGKLPEASTGDTRDKVGKAVGMSGKTYEKAKAGTR